MDNQDQYSGANIPAFQHGACLIVPIEQADHYFESLQPAPVRSRGDTNLHDVESFILFVKQETTDSTRIYFDTKIEKFVAVFNDNFMDQPGWRDHTASFYCDVSDIDQVRASIEEGTGLAVLNGAIG